MINLALGDCVGALKSMPAGYADLVLTSPPYNMNLRIRNGRYCSRQIVKEISTKYRAFPDNLPMDAYLSFNRAVIAELLRVCRGPVFYNVQFLTGNKPALFSLIGEFANQLKEVIVWDKVNAQPAIGSGILNSQFEVILVFDGEGAISRKFEAAQFERGTLSNVWQVKRGAKPSAAHGAVFPLELAERVVGNFSARGAMVLDPFMGCGTTGVACKKLGRSFFGVELDPEYFTLAKTRIADTEAD